MTPNYKFLFHYSDLRSPELSWAYFSVDDQSRYWNGEEMTKGKISKTKPKIVYGSSPEECIKMAIKLGYHD